MSNKKSVSTLNAQREAVFGKGRAVITKFRKAVKAVATATLDIRAYLNEVTDVTGQGWAKLVIGTSKNAEGKNKANTTDPEAVAHIVAFGLAVKKAHAEGTFSTYDADKIKKLGGAEAAMDTALKAANTWWNESIKGGKQDDVQVTKSGKVVKAATKKAGKKNGKVTDLVEVADQQALNYINAITALIDLAPDTDDAKELKTIRESIAGYHGLEI
jgi:hypothetical protein